MASSVASLRKNSPFLHVRLCLSQAAHHHHGCWLARTDSERQPTARQSAHRPECSPHLGREEFGLLPRSEVPAPVHLVEVRDVWVGVLDPAARGLPELAGGGGKNEWERTLRRRAARREAVG